MAALALAAAFCITHPAHAVAFEVVHTFEGHPWGANVKAGLVLGADGRLYGTTVDTRDSGYASIYSIDPANGGFSRVWVAEGIGQISNALVRDSAGVLYGVGNSGLLQPGNRSGGGTIFSFNPATGIATTLHVLDPELEGSRPFELELGSDGRLYGTTGLGGANTRGALFAVRPDNGEFTVIRHFQDPQNEGNPYSGVTQASDGRLYGVAGPSDAQNSALYSVAIDGSGFTIIRRFGPDIRPSGSPVEGPDGRVFGVLREGGPTNSGVLYSIEKDGTDFKSLHAFHYALEGAEPVGTLLIDGGRIYGVLWHWGPVTQDWPTGHGSVYSVNLDGSDFSILHFFNGVTDVAHPVGGLVRGPDGRIYGTAEGGPSYPLSTVFAVDPEAALLPEISSAPTAQGSYNQEFEYRIVATKGPTSYGAENLPPGLSVDSMTGLIQGKPGLPGEFPVVVSATNDKGTGTAEVVFTIKKLSAAVFLRDLLQAYDGSPRAPTVETNPAGLGHSITYNGSAITPTEIGTYDAVVSVEDTYYAGQAAGSFRIEDPLKMPPSIKVQPVDQTATQGQPVVFSVVAEGGPPLAYQWKIGDADVPGATNPTFTLPSVSIPDMWTHYRVAVSNPFGTVLSSTAHLTVNAPIVFTQNPESYHVVTGANVEFHVAYSGTGITGVRWKKNGVFVAGADFEILRLYNVTSADSGSYTVVFTNALGDFESEPGVLNVDVTPRMINVSCRAYAGSGNDTLIMGFYISGTGRKRVLVRGVGPTLANYNVLDPVADPRIAIYRGGMLVAEDDNWDPVVDPDFEPVGAFRLPYFSKDAAMTVELEPGLYTVHLVNNGPVAQGLIEVYDVSRDIGSRLTNVSCRFNMNPGQLVILGTVLIGDPVHILVRNVGPGLAPYLSNPDGVLPDPFIRVYRGQIEVGHNNEWDDSAGAYFGSTGAFSLPVGSKDAAIRTLFSAGGYTVHATDNTGGGGIALIELYESQ